MSSPAKSDRPRSSRSNGVRVARRDVHRRGYGRPATLDVQRQSSASTPTGLCRLLATTRTRRVRLVKLCDQPRDTVTGDDMLWFVERPRCRADTVSECFPVLPLRSPINPRIRPITRSEIVATEGAGIAKRFRPRCADTGAAPVRACGVELTHQRVVCDWTDVTGRIDARRVRSRRVPDGSEAARVNMFKYLVLAEREGFVRLRQGYGEISSCQRRHPAVAR